MDSELDSDLESTIGLLADSSPQCYVCGGPIPTCSAHKCLNCKNAVHAICGKNPEGEEGYGVPVVCNRCCGSKKKNQKNENEIESGLAGAKYKITPDIPIQDKQKWWIQPSIIGKKSKPTDEKKTWGICVTCFRAGKCPDVYQLCRTNNTTLARHAKRRHNNNVSEVVVRPYYDHDETVRKAREKCEKNKRGVETVVHRVKACDTSVDSASGKSDLGLELLPEQVEGKSSKISAQTVDPPVPVKRTPPQKVQTALCFEDRSVQNQPVEASLHSNIDTLIGEFKELKLQVKSAAKGKETGPNPYVAIDGKSLGETAELLLQWPEVKNILDLVRVSKHVQFFSGDAEKGVLSVVRCETCYQYIKVFKRSSSLASIPMTIARKGLCGFSGSLATGLIYSSERTSLLLEGGNQEFYKLKNNVKNHITLAGGQVHFEALQYQRECSRREERGLSVMNNLVSIALTVVKTKSAALHYETLVASHAFTGSDVGELGHGRKQFSAILHAAEVWCDRQIATFLSTPLPSTKLPPHYYATCDKSTPNRISNQAVMVCPMVEGHRKAIAVSAPEVYRTTETNVDGDVSGARAPELAKTVFREVKTAYPTITESTLKGAWMGTVCDEAYATATEFETTLATILDQERYDSSFFSVLWDPPHFIDLAFSDVFEGKYGTSQKFVSRLVQWSCVVHRIFQRGKMLTHAMAMKETEDEFVLKLTSRACSTRFTTSQYVEFLKLLESLPLFIKTFREFQFSEIKEYQIAGEDFLLDLCGICDILKPLMNLFITLQGLSVPCWKVVSWWPSLKSHMESMQESFSIESPTSSFPLLKKYSRDTLSGKFKGTELVQGWSITSTKSSLDDAGTKTTVDHWESREKNDVEADLQVFMTDLISSFDTRMIKGSRELMSTLTCLDLDSIFSFLCGERLKSGKIKLSDGEGSLERYGKADFDRFFTYVCSLDHVQRLCRDQEGADLLFDHVFAHVVLYKIKQTLKTCLWRSEGNYPAKWFSLPSIAPKAYGPLAKLSIEKSKSVQGEEGESFCLGNVYSLTFDSVKKPILAELDEAAVYHSIYCEEEMFNAIGIEGCVAIDIALAKGGTEAVVESFYSVMSQTLALRTKLDWCMPPILQTARAVKEIAKIYLDGDEEASLPKHALPILGDRAKYVKEGKVLKRQRTEDVTLPFLL